MLEILEKKRKRRGSFELRLATKMDSFKSKECASEKISTLKELVTTVSKSRISLRNLYFFVKNMTMEEVAKKST